MLVRASKPFSVNSTAVPFAVWDLNDGENALAKSQKSALLVVFTFASAVANDFYATVISIKETNEEPKRKVVMLEVNAFRKGSEKVFIAPHVHSHGRYHVDQNMINNAYSELPGVEEHKALTEG